MRVVTEDLILPVLTLLCPSDAAFLYTGRNELRVASILQRSRARGRMKSVTQKLCLRVLAGSESLQRSLLVKFSSGVILTSVLSHFNSYHRWRHFIPSSVDTSAPGWSRLSAHQFVLSFINSSMISCIRRSTVMTGQQQEMQSCPVRGR